MIFVVYSCGRKRHVDSEGLADYVATLLSRGSEVRVTMCDEQYLGSVLAAATAVK